MSEVQKPRVHRFVSNDFTVRASAVDATSVVREMQQLQEMLPLPTVAVGRAMVGSLLLASHLKEGQNVGLYFKGSGPLTAIYAEAAFNGQVRGYCPVPLYQPENYDQGLSLKNYLGKGTLTVTRHQPFQKQPFQGTVAMDSGEIGEDIAHYLNQSHQIRSLVSLGVYLDTYGKVKSAGGIIIEVMPGVEDAIVDRIEQNAKTQSQSISQLMMAGAKPIDLITPYFQGIPFTELDHPYPIEYFCPCTKDRVMSALELFGEEELQDMIEKDKGAAVVCQMCGKPYEVSIGELVEIKSTLAKRKMH